MSENENNTGTLTPIKWILVHGNPRSGTGLMARTISHACKRYVGDWGLCDLLKEVTENANARFDKDQLLKDISSNILANAQHREGHQFDLVFKQAVLSEGEYRVLESIWGKPKKNIYCFRSPDEYIHSAIIKFANSDVDRLKKLYENQMKRFNVIGGQCFEYHAKLTTEDYLRFLAPIQIERERLEKFAHKGVSDRRNVSPRMWGVYNELLAVAETHTS